MLSVFPDVSIVWSHRDPLLCIASIASITWLGHVGIPAPAEFFVFLFSGDRLYPTLRTSHLLLGVASVVLISVVSTIYPARIATRVEPVVAMQGRD